MNAIAYGISAVRTTDGDDLLRFESVTELADIGDVAGRFRAEYAARPDVRIEIDAFPLT